MSKPHEGEMERLSFDEWMGRALFDPKEGYYGAKIRSVGARGDFSTSASLNSVLAKAIARWLKAELESGGDGACRTIVEVGGGTGKLMKELRQNLGFWYSWRKGLRWWMVETSAPLREEQRKTLKGWKTEWSEEVGEVLEACGGKALIFHHELVDAFPVQVWRWSAELEQWGKLGLKLRQKAVQGEWVEYDDQKSGFQPESSALELWKTGDLRDGQRVEVHQSYREWLHRWAGKWVGGAMLTIDYGSVMPELYERRPLGTIRAYHRHQRYEQEAVYHRMGEQDLTCDVNFTDLQAWGAALGWRSEKLMSQAEFVSKYDPAVEREKAPSVQFVMDEAGVGTAFKVLLQRARTELR